MLRREINDILPHLISYAVHCLFPRNHFIVHSIVFFGKVGRIASENVIAELLKKEMFAVLVLWTGNLPFDPVSAQIVRVCSQ